MKGILQPPLSFASCGLLIHKNWITKESGILPRFPRIEITGNREYRYKILENIVRKTEERSCAIFAYSLDDSMCSVIKTEINGKTYYLSNEQYAYNNMHAFCELAIFFKIEKYALIIQESFGKWRVIDK